MTQLLGLPRGSEDGDFSPSSRLYLSNGLFPKQCWGLALVGWLLADADFMQRAFFKWELYGYKQQKAGHQSVRPA